MDWSALITQIVVTGGALGTAWLSLRGKLAEIAKTGTEARTDAAAARVASEKTESSINHDPETITKRLSDLKGSLESHGEILSNIKGSQADQGETLERMKRVQTEQGRDIRGLRSDDGTMRGEVREVRRDLSAHLTQAEESMAVVRRMAPIVNRLNLDK